MRPRKEFIQISGEINYATRTTTAMEKQMKLGSLRQTQAEAEQTDGRADSQLGEMTAEFRWKGKSK